MTGTLIACLLAGYGVAIPVGAIGVLIVGLAARNSLAVGAGAGLGAATADGVYATLAVLGGAALARLVAPIATPLRLVSAAVLVALAARGAITAVRHHSRPAQAAQARTGLGTPLRAYAGVLALTLLNPATVVYFAALVLGRQASGSLPAAQSVVFVVAAFLASASWQLLLAGGGSLIGRALTGPRGQLGTALVSSAVIAALAAQLALR